MHMLVVKIIILVVVILLVVLFAAFCSAGAMDFGAGIRRKDRRWGLDRVCA